MSTSISDRFLLVRGKIKQGDFAKELGINPNTLRNYENGRVSPSHKILERICVEFSVSPRWLLLGEGPMRAEQEGESPRIGEHSAGVEVRTRQGQEASCPRCSRLEAELQKERDERRSLAEENRQLYRERINQEKLIGELRLAVQEINKGAPSATDVARFAQSAPTPTVHSD